MRCSGRRGGGSARGVSARGVSAWGVCPSACWDTHTPVNRITDACENKTLRDYVAYGKFKSPIGRMERENLDRKGRPRKKKYTEVELIIKKVTM